MSDLKFYQQTPASQIHNMCLLAHVDHGKTTLSDYFLMANGLLSSQLAGQVRLLDSRPDEQERLITMKASCVALHHKYNSSTHIIHLVDCPGHIDFSSEVSSALRLCDGALIVIDVVDGVTMQTQSMLRQGFCQGLSMCLVVNKLDHLILTLGMTPTEAYYRVSNIITDCNVVLSAFLNQITIAGTHQEVLSLFKLPQDEVWFSPEKGNVVFGSGLDGFGFSLESLASVYEKFFNGKVSRQALLEGLWGEKYFDGKAGVFTPVPKKPDQSLSAVQLVFEPIWKLYQAFLGNNDGEAPADEKTLEQMVAKIGVPNRVWKGANRKPRDQLQAVLRAWLPLSHCLLDLVCAQVPSAMSAQQVRLPLFLPQLDDSHLLAKQAICACDPKGPLTAFIAKLIDTEYLAGTCQYGERVQVNLDESFIGFARIYSGTITRGHDVVIQSGGNAPVVTKVRDLYVLRGQGLEPVDAVQAGCLCGIGGISQYIVKYATVSDLRSGLSAASEAEVEGSTQLKEPILPPFRPPVMSSSSIVRYAVMPKQPSDLGMLLKGLQLLYRCDPQVDLAILPTGEHVIAVAGEVHGERCMEDLKTTFAPGIELTISKPIMSFREALVSNVVKPKQITVSTPEHSFSITLHAYTLPPNVIEALSDETTNKNTSEFIERILTLMSEHAKEQRRPWEALLQRPLLATGPTKFGFVGALLFDLHETSNDSTEENDSSAKHTATMKQFWDTILSGFQLAVSCGPMCEEPMFGACFVIDNVSFCDTGSSAGEGSNLAGLNLKIISCVANACRLAFQQHDQRLVEPMYECVVYSSGATQGKVYTILNRRRCVALEETPLEGSDLFTISAHMPVAESFGLQDELRIGTSGAATSQLRLSHWRIIDIDPYFKPTTKDEIEDFGSEKELPLNLAAALLSSIRHRKGIQRKNIVENAEKQKFSVRGA